METTSSDLTAKGSKSARAGLTFPVARIQRHLRKGNYANHIGTAGSVYLTGVLEYLVAEILELSGSATKENQRVRIIPRHIMMAIKSDMELNELLKGVNFSESGVMPNIHPVLVNKSKPKTVAPNNNTNDSNNVEMGGHNDAGNNDENEEVETEEDDEEETEDEEDDADGSVVAGSQNF